MKKSFKAALLAVIASVAVSSVFAEEYVIDTKGMHAFVQFRVKHLGYTWLYGRFNNFSGNFTYDEKGAAISDVSVEIDTTSLDSNNAERDKHLRSADFLDTDQFPTATFESASYSSTGDKTGDLTGNLTLHGVTKEITINVEHIGGGDDPWGGYRNGFQGMASIKPNDFGVDMIGQLGPVSETLELILTAEGIRQ